MSPAKEPEMQIRLVKDASDELIEECIALCVRAYVNDVCAEAMTGGDRTLRAQLFRTYFGAARVAGAIHIVTPRDAETVIAVAIWFLPGSMAMDSDAQRKQGFNEFMASVKPEIREWWTGPLPKGFQEGEELYFGKDGMLNSLYLNIIATDPVHQRKGYGSMLIRAGFAQAAEDKVVAAAGVPLKSVTDWLVRLGFENLGSVHIAGPKVDVQVEFDAFCLRCNDPQNYVEAR